MTRAVRIQRTADTYSAHRLLDARTGDPLHLGLFPRRDDAASYIRNRRWSLALPDAPQEVSDEDEPDVTELSVDDVRRARRVAAARAQGGLDL